MRVLLDENISHTLRQQLTPHDVFTARYMNWLGVQNGQLLQQAIDAGFEVFVTLDKVLYKQERLAGRPIAVVLIHAHSSDMKHITPLVPEIVIAISHTKKGELTVVGPDPRLPSLE
jgi:predicted nuclease of predicted toxin-antitoxin system